MSEERPFVLILLTWLLRALNALFLVVCFPLHKLVSLTAPHVTKEEHTLQHRWLDLHPDNDNARSVQRVKDVCTYARAPAPEVVEHRLSLVHKLERPELHIDNRARMPAARAPRLWSSKAFQSAM